MSEVALSICIPTNGRIEILRRTLRSILENGANNDEYEIVISDNSNNNEIQNLEIEFGAYPNIRWGKSHSHGYMNSISALKMGRGELLKLHNNYTMMKDGALQKIINMVKVNRKEIPTIFFSNNNIEGIKTEIFNCFNDFIYRLSYQCTWSTGISFWKKDFESIGEINIDIMFPHVSFLFALYNKGKYIIENEEIFSNQEVKGQGGYNLFYVFGVEYLDLLSGIFESKIISKKTFIHLKIDLFYKFLVRWFYTTKLRDNDYTFNLKNIRESILVYYPFFGYYRLLLFAYIFPFYSSIMRRLKKLKPK